MNASNQSAPRGEAESPMETPDETAIERLLDKPLSPEDLREQTRRVAQPLQLADKDIVRLLVFQAGQELMAFKAVDVHQLTKATAVHTVPHRSNAVFRGLCSVDGDLLLCGDLTTLLQTGDDPGRQRHRNWMIVVGDPKNRWAVQVDAVRGVVAVPEHRFRQPPVTVQAALARCTTSLVPLDDDTVALLDLQRVVSGFQAAL